MKFSCSTVVWLLFFAGFASTALAAMQPQQKEAHCLALAIYFEARGESDLGKLAVGSVVLNRAESSDFPNTVCGVVKQGGETPPCQFSWWCDGRSDRPENKKSWQASYRLANKILRHGARDPTGGALYFHSTAINPRWRLQRVGRIGSHIFYQ